LAAASLACEREVWDRCINTSERTKNEFDAAQRYPTPLKSEVVYHSTNAGLDPAYVYGLIRQESRFVSTARSGVGASGLMQVMRETARIVARRIGLSHYTDGMLNDKDINLQLGTSYLKMALDDFEGSKPMALAAYNAGPGRPRRWREAITTPIRLEPAIWAETIPFSETRDYVKKVLSNNVMYAALLTSKPQSLKEQLGQAIGPRSLIAPSVDRGLP
jgi:soluble lytic murein transglycosylase